MYPNRSKVGNEPKSAPAECTSVERRRIKRRSTEITQQVKIFKKKILLDFTNYIKKSLT